MKSEARSTLSDFNVEVVRLTSVEQHPNADRLDLAKFGGTTVVIRKGEFTANDLAVHVPVDAIVPIDRPEFSFLPKPRIRAARLRGVYSEGLLIKAPNEAKEGDDVAALFGITKYLSDADKVESENPAAKGKGIPSDIMPVYGLDSLRRFPDKIKEGTLVVLTEKIHGCNARYLYENGRLYIGSHKSIRGATQHRLVEAANRVWLRIKRLFGKGGRTDTIEQQGDVWWRVAQQYELKEKLARFPGYVFFGEVYGQGLQKRGGVDFVYDSPVGHKFRVFDIYDKKNQRYLSYYQMDTICGGLGLSVAPWLAQGTWPLDYVGTETGPSRIGNHMKEGYVVRTDVKSPDRNRVILKCVSEEYKLLGEKD